jgi:uncharacterized protein
MATLDAALFRSMMTNGYLDLKTHLDEINDLNVFPVPDGDTGSNMGSTMNGGVLALSNCPSSSVGELANKMAEGMLLSARGNSGVILSQFFSGFAKGLSDIPSPSLSQFALAMSQGVAKAYSIVAKPVEGTILTVMREGCQEALDALSPTMSFADYFSSLISAMRRSLKKTPELLPILKQAGVIDSGGAGLVYIVEGMGQALGGKIIEDVSLGISSSDNKHVDLSAYNADTPLDYGYCTEFILQLSNAKNGVKSFSLDDLIGYFNTLGDSLVAFRQESIVKVHVHTKTPEKVIEYARKYGEFLTFKMENMTLQHNETLVQKSRHRLFLSKPLEPRKNIGIVAVSPSQEFADRFKEYGADEVILSDDTMSVSAQEFVEAIKRANADNVIVLPNNKNEIMVAEQACSSCSDIKATVCPSFDLAIGIGAASVMDKINFSLEENLDYANNEIKNAVSLKVGKTSKDFMLGEEKVAAGQYLGLLQGKPLAYGSSFLEAFSSLIDKIEDLGDKAVLTMFFANEINEEERKAAEDYAKDRSGGFLEAYSLLGGQKIYQMIALLE